VSAGHENAHSLHTVDSDAKSFVWDNSAPPALEIESGETLTLCCHDALGGPARPRLDDS
jgi:acetamidase/formamidase